MVSVKYHAIAIFIIWCTVVEMQAQIQFKLQWLPDSSAWGVFIRPANGYAPSLNTAVGSGQVTVVAPAGTQFQKLNNLSGEWAQNAYIPAPRENPKMDYICFGFIKDNPPIEIQAGEETLLFTFAPKNGHCPDTLYLISEDDPFMVFPNSAFANVGNEIAIFDVAHRTMYHYSENYAPEAWNCRPGKTTAPKHFRQGDPARKNKRFNKP